MHVRVQELPAGGRTQDADRLGPLRRPVALTTLEVAPVVLVVRVSLAEVEHLECERTGIGIARSDRVFRQRVDRERLAVQMLPRLAHALGPHLPEEPAGGVVPHALAEEADTVAGPGEMPLVSVPA